MWEDDLLLWYCLDDVLHFDHIDMVRQLGTVFSDLRNVRQGITRLMMLQVFVRMSLPMHGHTMRHILLLKILVILFIFLFGLLRYDAIC